MACCLMAPSHFLSQSWPRSILPYMASLGQNELIYWTVINFTCPTKTWAYFHRSYHMRMVLAKRTSLKSVIPLNEECLMWPEIIDRKHALFFTHKQLRTHGSKLSTGAKAPAHQYPQCCLTCIVLDQFFLQKIWHLKWTALGNKIILKKKNYLFKG